MINVKSNGNGKSITENDDLSFQSMTITPSDDTPFYLTTNNLFSYNRFSGIFSGIIYFREVSLPAKTKFLTLPVAPPNEISVLCTAYVQNTVQNNKAVTIDTNGNVYFLYDTNFNYSDYVSLNFSFPIGGGS